MGFLLIALRLSIVCFTLIAITHFQNLQMWGSAANLSPVCNTPECQTLGEYYQRNMNINGQPCTDFYDYVCHNWPTHNPRPAELNYEYIWVIEQYLASKTTKQLIKLVENNNPSGSNNLERAKVLYKLCKSIPFLPRHSANNIRNIMKTIGDFPLLERINTTVPSELNWWEIDQQYLKLTGESTFFDFNLAFDPDLPNEILTVLEPPFSSYGAIYRTYEWPRGNELQHYTEFLKTIVRSLAAPNSPISEETINRDIKEVMAFRHELTVNMAWQIVSANTQTINIKEFQERYNSASLARKNSVMNWLEEIRAIYPGTNPHSPKITETSRVQVPNTYITFLSGLLGSTPRRVIVNHIQLYFAERHIEYTPQMQAELKASVTDRGSEANGILRSTTPRWKACMETEYMKQLLEKDYAKSYFPRKDKLKVIDLFNRAKEILQQQISGSTWLDNSTKIISIDKVKKLTATIGYPDSYDTNKATRSHLDRVSPLDIDARFENAHNQINVAAAYLQSPMFTSNVPYVVDYGATLNVIAHEATHAFDRDGIKFDAKGIFPWWSNPMKLERAKHTKCFEVQFKKFKEIEFKKLKLTPNSNRTFMDTLDEDVSDVMGLKISYQAFQQTLTKNKGYCPVLPGFQKFSCEQLFFIAFANTVCSSVPPTQQEFLLYADTHSLPQIRVNGVVANMKEFSAAFGCKPNDLLNPKETCDLWK